MPQDNPNVSVHYSGQPQVAINKDDQSVILKYPGRKGYTPPISPIQIAREGSAQGENVYETERISVRTPDNMKLSVFEDSDGGTRCSISPDGSRGNRGDICVSIGEDKQQVPEIQTTKLVIDPIRCDVRTPTKLQVCPKKTICKKCGRRKMAADDTYELSEQMSETATVISDVVCDHCLRHGYVAIDSKDPGFKIGRSRTPESRSGRSRTPESRSGRTHTPESRSGRTHTPESRSGRIRTPEPHIRRPDTPETKLVKQTCSCGKVIYKRVIITTKDEESQVIPTDITCPKCAEVRNQYTEPYDREDSPPPVDESLDKPCHPFKHVHPLKCQYDKWDDHDIDTSKPICRASTCKYRAMKELQDRSPKFDTFNSILYEDINFAETLFRRCKCCNNIFSFRPTECMKKESDMPSICDVCSMPGYPLHCHHTPYHYPYIHHHHHPPQPQPQPLPLPLTLPHHHHHHDCCPKCGGQQSHVCEHCCAKNKVDAITSAQELSKEVPDVTGKRIYTFQQPLATNKKAAPTVVGNVSVDLSLCWDPSCEHRNKQPGKDVFGGSIAMGTAPFPIDFDINIDAASIPEFCKPYTKVDQTFDDESVCGTCEFSEPIETKPLKFKQGEVGRFEPYRHLYSYPPHSIEDKQMKDEETSVEESDSVTTLKETEEVSTATKEPTMVDMATSPDFIDDEEEEIITEEKSLQVDIEEEEKKAKDLIDSKKKPSACKRLLCCGSEQAAR